MNPFLTLASDAHALPDFDKISPEFAEPAIDELLRQTQQTLNTLLEKSATWNDFAVPYFAAIERLNRPWGVVAHLHHVQDNAGWRAAFNAILPKISAFFSALAQNEKLASQWEMLKNSGDSNEIHQKIALDEWRDFQLGGAFLNEADKKRFKTLDEELAMLSAKFSENVLDATNAFSYMATESEMAGVPESLKSAIKNETTYALTLQMPCYLPMMQFAQNRTLREKLYTAYVERASEFTPEWDNSALMRNILAKRREEAKLLDFQHFADLSTATKMAGSFKTAHDFLKDLLKRAKPFAEKDARQLKDFAEKTLKIKDFAPWDVAFASEKLKEATFDFSDEEVRAFFTLPRVLSGLFETVKRLYNVDFIQTAGRVWHADVFFYQLKKAGKPLGFLYLDLFARTEKHGGAWMNDLATRERLPNGEIVLPAALIVCNFQKNATLRHDEVLTLFHETGHALNHLLSTVDEVAASGIRRVEWDAVELPSQFMENYAWDYEVLKNLTAHEKTGEPLPRTLFDKMLKAKNFQSGLAFVRQIEFALFDLLAHADFLPKKDADILQLLKDVRAECCVLPSVDFNRFAHSFTHIFSGGYAAGYFSYKWAEVLSADAFAAFEESGDLFDATTAARFLNEILCRGGSRLALQSFTSFRGRAPQIDALLRHNGMLENQNV